MNYTEALAYINSIQEKLGSEYSLRDVEELARRVGNPERKVKVIHIAGTNGKGSVGNYISNILAKSGYVVGRYVSPTIFEYRERIQRIFCGLEEADRGERKRESGESCTGTAEGNACHGKTDIQSIYMSEGEMAEIATRLKKVCEEMVADGFNQPTAFEIETVMAFLLFEAWKVDAAVVECGLGGRLDATNIIPDPLLCVFTSISMDHMQILGDSVPEIAKEKYGIIRQGTTVVSKWQEECEALLREACKEKSVEIVFMNGAELLEGAYSIEETVFHYKNTKYAIRQGGAFQLENAAIAIEAVWTLVRLGFSRITEEAVKAGLCESRWLGRFDVVSKDPFLLVDGAHNSDAAKKLKISLTRYFPDERFTFVMGMFRDKEYEKVIDELMPLADKVYVVKAPGIRGLECAELCKSIQRAGILPENIFDCDSMEVALKKALEENCSGKTIVCGSLSILKEVYQFMERISIT